jgi:hypothetical protein
MATKEYPLESEKIKLVIEANIFRFSQKQSFSTQCVPRGTEQTRRSVRCRNSSRDGGRPSKAALQGEALNNPKLLRSRAGVVSVREKAS